MDRVRSVPITPTESAELVAACIYLAYMDDSIEFPAEFGQIIQITSAYLSRNMTRIALEMLQREGIVSLGQHEADGPLFYELTRSGLETIELKMRDEDSIISHVAHGEFDKSKDLELSSLRTWKTSPSDVIFTTNQIEAVRTHIAECTRIVMVSNFSQEERAQIDSLLKICTFALEMPTPKTPLIKKVLTYLRDIKDISSLVNQIWEQLFGVSPS